MKSYLLKNRNLLVKMEYETKEKLHIVSKLSKKLGLHFPNLNYYNLI
jgi:hypothetical protein